MKQKMLVTAARWKAIQAEARRIHRLALQREKRRRVTKQAPPNMAPVKLAEGATADA